MSENISNGAQTTLNGAINNSQTTGTLTSASGWPEAPFRALIAAEGGNTDELIYVGARSGTALSSIIRAVEPIADGTQVAQAHSSGATITQVLTRVGLINQGLNSGTIGALAYTSVNTSFGSGSYAALNIFDTEVYDTDGFHSTSSNTARITIPAGLSGKYLFSIQVYNSGASGQFVALKKNSTTYIAFDGPFSGADTMGTISLMVSADAGDYYEVFYGGNSTTWQANACWLGVYKLDSGKVGTGIGVRSHYTGSNQTASNGGSTALLFDTDVYDTDGFHDTGSNTTRFTIPAGLSGLYIMGGGFYASANCDSQIRLNGTTTIAFGRAAGGDASIVSYTIETAYRLNAGDYVELIAVGRGGSQTVYTDLPGASPHFWLARVDALPNSITRSVDVTLGANVTMTTAGTVYDGPSASFDPGTWLINTKALFTSSGNPVTFRTRLWDGTTIYDEGESYTNQNGYRITLSGFAIVILSATTTLTLSVDADTNSQTLRRDGGNGTTHTATRLSGIKIA